MKYPTINKYNMKRYEHVDGCVFRIDENICSIWTTEKRIKTKDIPLLEKEIREYESTSDNNS